MSTESWACMTSLTLSSTGSPISSPRANSELSHDCLSEWGVVPGRGGGVLKAQNWVHDCLSTWWTSSTSLRPISGSTSTTPLRYGLAVFARFKTYVIKLRWRSLKIKWDIENRSEEDHKLSQGTYGPERHQEDLGKPNLYEADQETEDERVELVDGLEEPSESPMTVGEGDTDLVLNCNHLCLKTLYDQIISLFWLCQASP